jgi:anti-sigma-K factor RskA
VSSSDQIRDPFLERIEAYALGALDPEERAAVAAHLATGCAECAKALAESSWLVGQLAYLAPESAPSEMLGSRLMQTVRSEAAQSRKSISLSFQSTIPFWIWGAAAAALLFALYNAHEARSLQERIHHMNVTLSQQAQLQQESAQQLAIARREAAILIDPKSLKIAMPAAKLSGTNDFPVLRATWSRDLGLLVTGQKIPVPPANRTLQLWLIPKAQGGKPLPSVTLRPDATGKFELLVTKPPDAPTSTKALAITEEPAGGSSQPTTPPIWVGAVTGK